MKKTRAEIDKIYMGLKEITEDNTLKFPMKTTYNIIRNKQILEPISETLRETIDSVVREHIGDKNTVSVESPEYVEIVKQMNEVGAEMEEVNVLTIKPEDLGNCEISAKTLDTLSFMIEGLNK